MRKKVGDIAGELPAGITGPNFNDEYGDVYSALYMLTADGLSLADLKARAEDIRQRLLRVPDVNKVDIIGERPEKIFIEFSHAKLATLGVTPQQIFDSVARQNAVVAGGSVDTSADRINVRVTGAFSGVGGDRRRAGRGRAAGRSGSATSPPCKRGYEDPRELHRPRRTASPRSASASSMQDGANIVTLGGNLERAMAAIAAELPVGIEVTQIADQPHIVEQSVAEFIKTFVEALLIVLVVSFLSLGWRTGIVVALSVPLVLAIVFLVMYAAGHRPAPHHARRADHRARAAGRRRHHRHRDDGGEDGAGLGPRPRRDLRLDLDRVSDADRHAGHRRRLPAGRLRQVERRRICRRHLLGRRPGADRVVVRRGAVHALSRA